MTKKEMIEVLSEKTGIDKSTIALVVNECHQTIIRTLKKGDEVKISGFGTFYPAERKSRKGRNPKTGESVELSGKYVPHFKPGKELRERVNLSVA